MYSTGHFVDKKTNTYYTLMGMLSLRGHDEMYGTWHASLTDMHLLIMGGQATKVSIIMI